MNPFHWAIGKFHHRFNCSSCRSYGIKTSGCSVRQRQQVKQKRLFRDMPLRLMIKKLERGTK